MLLEEDDKFLHFPIGKHDMNEAKQAELIKNLCIVLERAAPHHQVQLFETHISHVLLAGKFAYKIKKPVSLGFLDFRELEQRHFYCHEELRLNKRFAPDIYLDVIAVTGTTMYPQLDGPGAAIEYAVKMRQFPQERLAENLARDQNLQAADVLSIAQKLAAIHGASLHEVPDSQCGSGELVWQHISDTVNALRRMIVKGETQEKLAWLFDWCKSEFDEKLPPIEQRKRNGFVRECHGDLHLGNIAILDGTATFFDCIEFSDTLRRIDVINDMAFVAMDLHAHGRLDLSWLFISAYLEQTGDYYGPGVLRLYVVHRALVRYYVFASSPKSCEHVGDAISGA